MPTPASVPPVVVELVGPDRAVRRGPGERFGQTARVSDVVVRIAVWHRWHQDQLRPHQAQHVLLFLALRLRHHDHGLVAETIAHQGEPDPGVASGSFDDRPARVQQASGFGVAHDEQRRAVLDRLAGIEEFGLAENGAAGLFRSAAQPDERRIADQIDERPRLHARACPLHDARS
jgi:hypothetical protein